VDRTRNRVLAEFSRSSPEASSRFFRELEPVALERHAVLGTSRERTEFVYFVEYGIVSLVASTAGGRSLGIAIVGRDGVVGVSDALGRYPLPYSWVVQVAGFAHRVPTAIIRHHILSCTDFHELLMAYSQLVMHQLAQSALCNCFHTSVQRLARWLLLTAVRAGTNRFELTHEFISQMVGAPRSAVTQAAASLRGKKIIDYHRGVLTIRNVKRLHQAACECFDAISHASNGDELHDLVQATLDEHQVEQQESSSV
jgi:CRP-like cAMP-binding protein